MAELARLGLLWGLLLGTTTVLGEERQAGDEAPAATATRLATGACCRCSVCTVETEQACWELGGAWLGEATTCDPNPCAVVYCAPGAQVCDEYISRVQIGTIDNPSGCEAGQYADYTGQSTELLVGQATPLVVTNGYPYAGDVCSVWIDWNHDCLFDDFAPEAIGDLQGSGPYNFSVTIPDTALVGPARLRIRLDYANANPDPCGVTVYGEVEDYTVVVPGPVGACCWPDGACAIVAQSACGGFWHGAGTACAGTDCNNNGADDLCDLANGMCDCQGDGVPDECQLWVEAPPHTLAWDDGSSENSLGLSGAGELCWMVHSFMPPGVLLGVQVCFGTPLYPGESGVSAGQLVRVYVWSDPNGDGNPADAVFLSEATGEVEGGSIDTDVLQTIPLSQPISGRFFIGASVVTTSGHPAAMDQNGPQFNQAWVAFNTVPFDPVNLGSLYNMTDIGYPCNWLLRALVSGGPVSNDCDADGIPDECDIGAEWGGYCQTPGGPCFPGVCSVDCNRDGFPCDDGGDLNNDGLVNIDDYWVFIAAYGTCVGQPGYNASADMDGDRCITLVDYQMWRCFYEMANGKDFVPPQPKPLPAPAKAAP